MSPGQALGVCVALPGFIDEVNGRVAPYYLRGLRIFSSRHGAESSLRGAVTLAFTRFWGGFGGESDSQSANSVHMRG
jgi:hypothetical protein